MKIAYISVKKMYLLQDNSVCEIKSEALARHERNLADIKSRHEWKESGSSAMFQNSGLSLFNQNEEPAYDITGICFSKKSNRFYYTMCTQSLGAVYSKESFDEPYESLFVSDNRIRITDLTCCDTEIAAAAISDIHPLEKHIALIGLNPPRITFATEGDCVDESPFYSRFQKDILYFTTSGIGRNSNSDFIAMGPHCINRLNLHTMEIEEVTDSCKMEYLKPKDDRQGNLYYIRRPYHNSRKYRSALLDILFFPVKLIRAFVGFLNYFTMRYSGDTLQSSGSNPHKSKGKSQRELFVEGNLINAQQILKQNASRKEKFPGIIPHDWELVKQTADGKIIILKKGVLDYDVSEDGTVVYSNGEHIVQLNADRTEQHLGKAELAVKITILE